MSIEVNKRPLVTFFVCAYKQERFIREAVEGAFAQTYSPLEIILSDDCSPDRTFEIMREMAAAYRGPHKIILNRNEKNLGIGGYINRIFELSHGELLVASAGDDVSLPYRVQALMQAVSREDRCMAIGSAFLTRMEGSHSNSREGLARRIPGLVSESHSPAISPTNMIRGATAMWHRKVFASFPPLSSSVVAEDIVLSFRARLLGDVLEIPEPLVFYRPGGISHGVSLEDGLVQHEKFQSIYASRAANALLQFSTDLKFVCEGSTRLHVPENAAMLALISKATKTYEYQVGWWKIAFLQRLGRALKVHLLSDKPIPGSWFLTRLFPWPIFVFLKMIQAHVKRIRRNQL